MTTTLQRIKQMIRGFIFDLDGVLTDTSRLHFEAWKKLSDNHGLYFDSKINEELKGISRKDSLNTILEKNDKLCYYSIKEKDDLLDEKNGIYLELIKNITPSDILPNIECFLNMLKKENYKIAVASASKNATMVLNSLGLTGEFNYIANASLIKHSKPNPEIFLDCAYNLGLNPDECVGIEDAQAGIEAIKGANMFAIGIGSFQGTIKPDICLGSTEELEYGVIMSKIREIGCK